MMETALLASLLFLALLVFVVLLNTQRKILKELKNIHIPPPQKIQFPKIEFPRIEIPQSKEIILDLNPVIEAVNNLKPVIEAIKDTPKEIVTTEFLQSLADTQRDLIKALQETSILMRVNQFEFQSGLEVFHKTMEKLLAQIPNGEKELNAQKEFMQKFEETFVKVQETAAEAMSENSLRLQEILTEFLNKEVANR